DLGLQAELFNTPGRNFGKVDAASIRIVQANLRLYYNHNSNEILIDILSGSSTILQEIANKNVQVYSTLAAGLLLGGETFQQRTWGEFTNAFSSWGQKKNIRHLRQHPEKLH